MSDDGRQYEPAPYDIGLTDVPEMTWAEYQAARDHVWPELPDAPALPCLVPVPEPEAEAGL